MSTPRDLHVFSPGLSLSLSLVSSEEFVEESEEALRGGEGEEGR